MRETNYMKLLAVKKILGKINTLSSLKQWTGKSNTWTQGKGKLVFFHHLLHQYVDIFSSFPPSDSICSFTLLTNLKDSFSCAMFDDFLVCFFTAF